MWEPLLTNWTDTFEIFKINGCHGYIQVCCQIYMSKKEHQKFNMLFEAVLKNALNKSGFIEHVLWSFINKYCQSILFVTSYKYQLTLV